MQQGTGADEVLAAITADPATTLVAADFDGTLAPIVDDPERAFADPAAVDALARLGRVVGTVAVITGRPVRTAVRLGGFAGRDGLGSMVVLGQYGVERWDADGDRYDVPPDPPELAAVAEAVPALLAAHDAEGARVEDKGRAIGIHTRELPDAAAAFERLRGPVAALAERHGLHLEPGKQVLEIRVPGMDKGHAIEALVAERGARQVVFAGDDLGDLPAFAAVRGLAGDGVRGLLVCSGSTEERALTDQADVVVDGPSGVADWLSALADRLGA